MSLVTVIQNLATRIGTEFKSVRVLIGGAGTSDVSALATTATNLVAAINEVLGIANAASGAAINDAATATDSVWSSSKTAQEIVDAVNAVLDGAPGALDTLNEMAAALGDDANFASTVTTALSNRLRFDAAQTLTTPQKLQACTNIGVGDPDTNFVTVFETAIA